MDWKSALRDLRTHLPPGRGGGQGGVQRGSLRWLEQEMARRGGNPAALRNIIYRDTGTPADKAILTAILTDLSREAGRALDLPARPGPATLPDELELLGRTKKRIYKQFLAGVTSAPLSTLAFLYFLEPLSREWKMRLGLPMALCLLMMGPSLARVISPALIDSFPATSPSSR